MADELNCISGLFVADEAPESVLLHFAVNDDGLPMESDGIFDREFEENCHFDAVLTAQILQRHIAFNLERDSAQKWKFVVQFFL